MFRVFFQHLAGCSHLRHRKTGNPPKRTPGDRAETHKILCAAFNRPAGLTPVVPATQILSPGLKSDILHGKTGHILGRNLPLHRISSAVSHACAVTLYYNTTCLPILQALFHLFSTGLQRPGPPSGVPAAHPAQGALTQTICHCKTPVAALCWGLPQPGGPRQPQPANRRPLWGRRRAQARKGPATAVAGPLFAGGAAWALPCLYATLPVICRQMPFTSSVQVK